MPGNNSKPGKKRMPEKKKKIEDIMLFSVMIVIILLILGGYQLFNRNSDNDRNSKDTNNSRESESNLKEFRITASQWDFSPSTIEVNRGDRVKIVFTSTDVPHGFAISQYNINEYISSDQESSIEFVTDSQGSFTFTCSVHCGSGHGSMKGTLRVN